MYFPLPTTVKSPPNLTLNEHTAATIELRNKKNLCAAALLIDDLIVEILSWLPPSCAVRCKIVCKLWRMIIQSRHFIEKHWQRQEYIVIYIPPLPPDERPFLELFYLRGLWLEQNLINKATYRIRNYVTDQVFGLPDFEECCRIHVSMCYIPDRDEYKVLNLHWKEKDTSIGLKVFTKGIDAKWRSVKIPLQLSCSKINGEIAYARTLGNVNYIMKFSKFLNTVTKMMAFQIDDESFVAISLPWKVEFCATGSRFWAMTWGLDVSIGCMVGKELHIWVLEDYKTSKWEERKIVFSSDLVKLPFIAKLIPIGISDNEILVLGIPQANQLRKLSYNIKTKAFQITKMTQRFKPSLVSL